MYDLAKDLGETQDISKSNAAKAKELEASLVRYIKTNNPELLADSMN
jgi:hypothetical protein